MKRALLALSFTFAACTPTFLESGRYACERGQPDQCPGQWRCGLEEYCHQLGSTAVAWRCETDDDCEAKYVCGIPRSGEFRECHNPAMPQDWPCEVPTDCVGGWKCGLTASGDSRQCHDPAAPKSWPCETSDDCVGNWSCGLSTTERHECHDPLNPRAWVCLADSDCLGGWRCGTERLCVDPSADELGRPLLAELDGGAHLNPLGAKSPVSMLSVSPFYAEGRGRGRGNLAFVQDGHVQAMSFDSVSGGFSRYDLGTERPTALLAHGARGAASTGANDELDRVSMAWRDGGLSTLTFDGGAYSQFDYGSDIWPVDTLTHGSAASGLTPSVFAFTARPPGDLYLRMRGDDAFGYDLHASSDFADFQQVPNNRIRAMTSLRHEAHLECVYVVDERGLWVSQRGYTVGDPDDIDSWEFEPVNVDLFKHSACPSAGPKVTSAQAVGDRWLALTAEASGGPVQVGMLDTDRVWMDRDATDGEVFCSSFAYRPCDSDDRIRADLVFGPCAACPSGSTFSGMSTVPDPQGGPPVIEVMCGQPSAAGVVFRISSMPGTSECVRTLVTGGSSYFIEPDPKPSAPAPGVVGWSGSEGQIWFGSDSANIASVSFDRAATGMVRRGTGPGDFTAFTPQLIGTPSSALGLVSTRSTQLTAPVAHAPTFALSGAQLLDLSGTSTVSAGRTVGYVTALSLASSSTASLTNSAAGHHLAIVTSGTSLYAGDVEQVYAGSGPAVALTTRLSTVEPILSLSFPKEHALSAGPLLSGYAIVGSGVARVVAETLTRWRSEAVPLPPTLLPLSTWFQGTRGRVGFHDGTVFSLPSRVRISTPLPGNEAVDYAQACGQQLALAPDGLYRLEPDASGAIGKWVKLPLPPEVGSLDFTEGRVHGLGNDVFVFTRLGEAARVTFASCPN